MSERLIYFDLDIFNSNFTFIVSYFPHAGYADPCVEEMYNYLSTEHSQAKIRRRISVVAGDWNACVGVAGPGEPDKVIGSYGFGTRNSRGEWFLRWASLEDLCIVNTFFRYSDDNLWTHRKGDRVRQLDFTCIDMSAFKLVVNGGTTEDLTIGVDHKSVQMALLLSDNAASPERTKRKRRKKTCGKGLDAS